MRLGRVSCTDRQPERQSVHDRAGLRVQSARAGRLVPHGHHDRCPPGRQDHAGPRPVSRQTLRQPGVASEILKARANRGLEPELFHFREPRGLDVDLVLDEGLRATLVEAKSGATVAPEMLEPLNRLAGLLGGRCEQVDRVLVYGGDTVQLRSGVDVRSWSRLHERRWSARSAGAVDGRSRGVARRRGGRRAEEPLDQS